MRAVVVLNCLLVLCCVGCGSASEKPVPAGGKRNKKSLKKSKRGGKRNNKSRKN